MMESISAISNGKANVFSIPQRDLNTFMLQCALRLECQDKCYHLAVMILDKIKDCSIMSKVCNYTFALTVLSIACKAEEDLERNYRDFVNAGLSVLHNSQSTNTPKCDRDFMKIRQGLGSLEFLVLRELEFNLEYERKPLQYLYLYMHQLRCWIPDQFELHPLVERSMGILKDIYIETYIIHEHEPQEIAIACIEITLMGYGFYVSGCGTRGKPEWYETMYDAMTPKRLKKLLEIIFKSVYPSI